MVGHDFNRDSGNNRTFVIRQWNKIHSAEFTSSNPIFFLNSEAGNQRSLSYQPKQCTIFRGIPSNVPYICCLFDSPQNGWFNDPWKSPCHFPTTNNYISPFHGESSSQQPVIKFLRKKYCTRMVTLFFFSNWKIHYCKSLFVGGKKSHVSLRIRMSQKSLSLVPEK